MPPNYVSCVIVKGWCLGTPRCTPLLLSALLAGALHVQSHKLSDLQLQVCSCAVEQYMFLAADGVHPRVLQELR